MKDNEAFEPDEVGHPDFSSIDLDEGGKPLKKKKVPRRILHFSDGILEEYSTDEDEVDAVHTPQTVVDPRTLPWGPWFWNRLLTTSTRTLKIIDFCGEKLAGLLGILDSRYQYAIDQHRKDEVEEEKEKKLEMLEQEAVRMRQLRKVEVMESGNADIKVISSGDVNPVPKKVPLSEVEQPTEQI